MFPFLVFAAHFDQQPRQGGDHAPGLGTRVNAVFDQGVNVGAGIGGRGRGNHGAALAVATAGTGKIRRSMSSHRNRIDPSGKRT
jgi:hypothetical protein